VLRFPHLNSRLEANDRQARYLLGRMRDKDLRRVVTEPLKLAGVGKGDREALASSVLRDVGSVASGTVSLTGLSWNTTRRDPPEDTFLGGTDPRSRPTLGSSRVDNTA